MITFHIPGVIFLITIEITVTMKIQITGINRKSVNAAAGDAGVDEQGSGFVEDQHGVAAGAAGQGTQFQQKGSTS